ncbi:MAG: hypothetical protein IKM59_00780 [Oscillospiraceae bacterium]|nr:hypothetical protein [Oscillospiraceae bacterium]
MKRITAIFLLLCLSMSLWGCKKDPAVESSSLRHEDGTAYYTREQATCSMELEFAEPLASGSLVELLLGTDTLLSFTTEAEASRLVLSSEKLQKNFSYTLKINGIPQKHGKSQEKPTFPQPGDIPDPSLPTQPPIPQEPMGQPDSGMIIETIPTLTGPAIPLTPVESRPTRPTESGRDSLLLKPVIRDRNAVFTLTDAVTVFTDVRNAD